MNEAKMDYSNMSIYKKIQLVKQRISKADIKKSGENKYAGFKYYELADFTPFIIDYCGEIGLFTKFTFNNEMAVLIIINSDKPEQKEEYTSPMRELELKGCNQIQALGGVETYSKRYLYMNAFDIVENDMFDATASKEEKTPTQKVTLAIPSQIENLKQLYSEEELKQALRFVKKTKLEELTVQEASSLISKRKKESNNE